MIGQCGGALCVKIRAAGLQGCCCYCCVDSLSYNHSTKLLLQKRCQSSEDYGSCKSIESETPNLCTEYHTSLAYHAGLESRRGRLGLSTFKGITFHINYA